MYKDPHPILNSDSMENLPWKKVFLPFFVPEIQIDHVISRDLTSNYQARKGKHPTYAMLTSKGL